jgi:glycosyltransferase involved in cell wall biosynthesis
VPLRFCMLTTFYPPYSFGGDAIFVRNLSTALAARGHEVHVIHCRDAYFALGGEAPESEPAASDVVVHGLENPVGALSPFATHQTGRPWFKARRIREILDQGFDVIHFHNISLIGGPALLEYGAGIKLYTFHEYWLVCQTHLLFRFNREPCEKRRCTLCALAHGRPPQWWRASGLIDRATRHIDSFLSPSRFAMTTHLQSGLDIPIEHLPSFVPDTGRVSEETSSEGYFLYVGRLEHIKGVHTLIEPFRRWGKVPLTIAGTGSEGRALRRLAGDSDRIQLLGHLSGEPLRRLYAGAIALVVPSLCFEIAPLVILEAFREGTPVIVRNRGALPEAVADSGGGLVYNDDDELVAALERLASDQKLRDELGRRGHDRYCSNWTAEAHVERYLGIIDRLREQRARRALTA